MARKTIEKNIAFDDVKNLYYVTMDYGKDDKGKRIKKTTTFKTKQEAKKSLKEFEADKTRQELVMPKKITVSFWLDYWMDNSIKPNKEANTIYGYQLMIKNHITPALGNIELQKLKPQQVQSYYTEKMKTLSSNTVLKHHVLLKTALGFAVKQDVIYRNPIDRVEAPKKIAPQIKFYNLEQLKTLNSLVKGDRMEIVVKLACYLGLRREEICGLKWDNIDFDNKVISISEARVQVGKDIFVKGTKSDASTRKDFICDDLLEVLKNEYKKQQEDKEYFGDEYDNQGLVVVWDNGKPYRPGYISELFTKIIKDNNLPTITLHGLRHSFASLSNSVGIPQFNASKMLGHSTPATTGKIYTHLYDDTHENEMNLIAEALKDNDKKE